MTKKWDMRSVYALHQGALSNTTNSANKVELYKLLQTIQRAAIREQDLISNIIEDEPHSHLEPVCVHIDYGQKVETKSTPEIIVELSELIRKIQDNHILDWAQLEPNQGKIQEFLRTIEQIAINLLNSLNEKTKKSRTVATMPAVKREKKPTPTTTTRSTSLLDNLWELLSGDRH